VVFFTISFITYSQTKDQSWKLYDDSQVAEIKVTMNSAAFDWMMNNPQSDSAHECTIYYKNKYIDTTISKVGIRIRGNTSRTAQKKSFKLSFNDFKKGGDFCDVKKINLNGEHNDPSIARSKVSWVLFQKSGLPSSRANHVAVYINDKYMGLYISVENIDDEFLKKQYYDASGNLYKCLYGASFASGSNNYNQETNEDKPDFSQIQRLISILNTVSTQALPDSLEKIMCVDEFLKYEAMNVLIGQWDDYWSNMNNFYLYFEPLAGKFHWIPYDYDNTFGIDWFNYDWSQADPFNFKKINSSKRPLIEKVMANNQYRDLYAHILQHMIKSTFQYYMMASIVFGIQEKIRPFALADSYRRRDYQFSDADFENSFNTVPYSIPKYGTHVKKSILQFVNERNIFLKDKLSLVGSSPIVYKLDYLPKNPGPNDSIYVYASGFASAGIEQVNIQYHPGLLTVIYFYKMKFSPVENSTIVDDADRWVGVIPPLGKNGFGKFKLEIIDNNGVKVIYPRYGFAELKSRQYSTGSNNILINEIMADNTKTIKDPANTTKDEYDDWIELFNTSKNDITLTGMYLTDDAAKLDKWQFTQPNLKMKPGEYLLVWCDEQGSQSGLHANFKLSKSGEYVALVSSDGKTIIDEFTFNEQQSDISYGRFPDGGQNWISMKPTPGSYNITTKVEDVNLPSQFYLAIFPNPFNPTTTIQYSIPNPSDVTIVVYDLIGKEVWKFYQSNVPTGTHKIRWEGVDKNNLKISSGVYICKVITENYSLVQKIILAK
jgi:spore coat protein CotH